MCCQRSCKRNIHLSTLLLNSCKKSRWCKYLELTTLQTFSWVLPSWKKLSFTSAGDNVEMCSENASLTVNLQWIFMAPFREFLKTLYGISNLQRSMGAARLLKIIGDAFTTSKINCFEDKHNDSPYYNVRIKKLHSCDPFRYMRSLYWWNSIIKKVI